MDVLYLRCAGLDVHKDSVVAGVRLVGDGPSGPRSAPSIRPRLDAGVIFVAAERGCAHVAMEATGVYWRPVWHVLSDGEFG